MKNQYFGDDNDWRKYYILRRLVQAGISMTVGWMLTPDDGSNDGKRRAYLTDRNHMGTADPVLFDWLTRWAADGARQDVTLLHPSGLLQGVRFHDRILGDASGDRDAWFAEFATKARGTDLVFLDPDNGLEIKTVARGRKRSSKYVYWTEIQSLLEAGFSVLVYQHVPRMDPGRSVSERIDQAFERLPIDHCISIRAVGANYFFFPATGQNERMSAAARSCDNLRDIGIDTRETTRARWAGPLFSWRLWHTTSKPSAVDPGTVSEPRAPVPPGASTAIGYTNRNGQRVLADTGLPGTDHGQRIYALRCDHCTEEYGANGSDIFQRLCPNCQKGRPGLPFRVN